MQLHSDKSNSYRFSGGGYRCLYCGSRTGWSYLRDYGKEYGTCFACGERRFPHTAQKQLWSSSLASEPAFSQPKQRILLSTVEQTLTAYAQNPFVQFLEQTFGSEVSRQVVKQFWIGTARNEGTVFWHADQEGSFRRPKVMYYGSDGRRIKDQPSKQMHYAGHTLEKGYSLPLFGEHQLNPQIYPPDTSVVLVESEKTACIGYACLPGYIWMATGGSTALNPARAAVLHNRAVLLLPDADTAGRKGAGRTLEILQKVGAKAQIKELFPDREDHYDIADYLIALVLGEI